MTPSVSAPGLGPSCNWGVIILISFFCQQPFQQNKCINSRPGKKFFVKIKEYLDDKYVKVVNAFDVVTGADFGDQLRIQEPGHNTRS